jgi:hypothetical protein
LLEPVAGDVSDDLVDKLEGADEGLTEVGAHGVSLAVRVAGKTPMSHMIARLTDISQKNPFCQWIPLGIAK